MPESKLIVQNKSLVVKIISSKGKETNCNIKESELSAPLLEKKKNAIAQLNGLEVEFEIAGGQPVQVREKGKDFSTSPQQGNTAVRVREGTANNSVTENVKGDFHNPYNFVPAPPRDSEKIQKSELGDRSPYGHNCYQDDLWSGKISVTLTTETPLLIPDAANATENEHNKHKTYPIRKDIDGKPYLPPTSLKGMLRSAYEAITNSRLSIFEKHKDRLAYRMPPQLGLQMVPVRIENGKVYLYPGTSTIASDDKPQGAMYAAWLPKYNSHNAQVSPSAVKYQDGQLPQHGQAVTAWLEKYRKVGRNGKSIFTYWRVRKMVPIGQSLGDMPTSRQSNGAHQPTGDAMIQVNGYVCITNKNIDKKHDERLFFCYKQEPIAIDLTNELKSKWKELISNYQEIHQNEIAQGMQSPPALNCSRWSRHITGGDKEKDLFDGALCYAHVYKNNGSYIVKDLYPVMITRGLYELSPETILPASLKPANSIEYLSPADRVFGWVNQDGEGAYKGQLKICSVKCDSNGAIELFPNNGTLPLTILGEPKPEQTRFYVAETPNGEPLENNRQKADGYKTNQGLRGRKVYPHHQLPENYWNTNAPEAQVNNRYREFLRVGKIQDNQNRSITAWVKPNIQFSFAIDVINLSSVELGALIWLLQLSNNFPDHFHRLGGGKPLGFGSVKLHITDTDLRTGQQWKEYYSSLLIINKPEQTAALNSTEEFQKAVVQFYGSDFEKISFIAAFLQSAKGFDKPIHYPRTNVKPQPDEESFNWFVKNEKLKQPSSLDSLANDNGLPYFSENE